MLAVHVRIIDRATGKPTPVRMCISTQDGTCFAPLGRTADFPTGRNEDVGGHLRIGREHWYYIDGSCEIQLPAGIPLRVRLTKGPEFAPLDTTVTLGTGQMAVRFTMERSTTSRADGWVSIDGRCHFLTPHAALFEAAAEGIDVVNLLVTPFLVLAHDGNTYTTTPNLLSWSGQVPALENAVYRVFVNTLNSHPVLGKVALLHAHRPIFPLTFGGEETDDWSICDWCDQCHRKGGLAVWVDAFEPAGGVIGGEALVAAILGKIEAIEISAAPRKTPLLPWLYRLWGAGYFVPLLGASGKDTNRTALGEMRTYARWDGESWVEAVRAGRTVATDGPLLTFEVIDGRFRASLGGKPESGTVEIVANGRVIADGKVQVECPVESAGWVAARWRTAGRLAHTSPLALEKPMCDPTARSALSKLVEQTIEWIQSNGRYQNPRRESALLDNCHKAMARLNG